MSSRDPGDADRSGPGSGQPVSLPGGLVLRPSRPSDHGQIEALLAERGDADDAIDHRLVVRDPDAGPEACAVVVDGDRVVSTAVLLDEHVRIGHGSTSVTMPAGQVELVATDRGHEGRGLVRALMGWAHRRSAERGHLLQVMIGIPYFYRRFGYEYAIDVPEAPTLTGVPEASGRSTLRRAVAADQEAMARLQDDLQATVDVAVAHSTPRWRWLLNRPGTTLWVLTREEGVAATGRSMADDGVVLLAEAAAVDRVAAADLVAAVAAEAGAEQLRVQLRGGPVGEVCRPLVGTRRQSAEQYYVRLPDPAVVLDALRPVLWSRHLASGYDAPDDALVVSTFGAHYRLPLAADGFGPVQVGGVMQAPGAVGGMGCAPDHLAALTFGPLGLAGLSRLRPDVYAAADTAWHEALFPPLTADLLMFYLPY